MMRQNQVCDHCRGCFGMVMHRWWGNKFCKRTCKDAYLRELALDRDKIRRWYGFPSRGDSFKLLSHPPQDARPNRSENRAILVAVPRPAGEHAWSSSIPLIVIGS